MEPDIFTRMIGTSTIKLLLTPLDDSRWAFPDWRDYRMFCPMGYTAALGIQARGAKARGKHGIARNWLLAARSILGNRCKTWDMLDRRIWGISSDDLWQDLIDVDSGFAGPAGESDDEGLKLSVHPKKAIQRFRDERLRLQWHALQLNTQFRFSLERHLERILASSHASQVDASPRLVMLAHHGYLSLFVVPVLELIWRKLDLLIVHLGKWEAHEKCPSCMERYAAEYVDSDSPLSDIPFDQRDKQQSGSGSIQWGSTFSLAHFSNLLKAAFTQYGKTAAAEVRICVAPMDVRGADGGGLTANASSGLGCLHSQCP
eukprot:TRINITY_DN111091_c0_g1_i1.p1 TRINITY_DN111091_c0_g1~~TRINITY_DN111091_c0_g1_i1.p1  ORF type:complete len:327 (+),score=37.01 TRINITY_DN111091_c0_g1_i1:34-981(+)